MTRVTLTDILEPLIKKHSVPDRDLLAIIALCMNYLEEGRSVKKLKKMVDAEYNYETAPVA